MGQLLASLCPRHCFPVCCTNTIPADVDHGLCERIYTPCDSSCWTRRPLLSSYARTKLHNRQPHARDQHMWGLWMRRGVVHCRRINVSAMSVRVRVCRRENGRMQRRQRVPRRLGRYAAVHMTWPAMPPPNRLPFMTREWLEEQRCMWFERNQTRYTDEQLVSGWWHTHYKLFH